MASAPKKKTTIESVKKTTSIGRSIRTVARSKQQKRSHKPYRGQGKP